MQCNPMAELRRVCWEQLRQRSEESDQKATRKTTPEQIADKLGQESPDLIRAFMQLNDTSDNQTRCQAAGKCQSHF